MPYDSRTKPIRRRIILDILDNTAIDIPGKDLDTIAEEFEETLQKHYDMTIDLISVEQHRE
jgi:hypothetical protein